MTIEQLKHEIKKRKSLQPTLSILNEIEKLQAELNEKEKYETKISN